MDRVVVVVFLLSFSHARASGLDLSRFAFLHGAIRRSAVPAVLYSQGVRAVHVLVLSRTYIMLRSSFFLYGPCLDLWAWIWL